MFPIAERFTRFEGKICANHLKPGTEIVIQPIESFDTLQAAKEACSTNIKCGCIDDWRCNGNSWYIYEDSALLPLNGSCAWTAGKC